MEGHNHSIALIYNNGKFLTYYDNAWKTMMFPVFHTWPVNDAQHIGVDIANDFGIDDSRVSVIYLAKKELDKYSIPDNDVYTYTYRFYKVSLKGYRIPDSFVIHGVQFKFMSLLEMLSDSSIEEVNSDIINIVKSLTAL